MEPALREEEAIIGGQSYSALEITMMQGLAGVPDHSESNEIAKIIVNTIDKVIPAASNLVAGYMDGSGYHIDPASRVALHALPFGLNIPLAVGSRIFLERRAKSITPAVSFPEELESVLTRDITLPEDYVPGQYAARIEEFLDRNVSTGKVLRVASVRTSMFSALGYAAGQFLGYLQRL